MRQEGRTEVVLKEDTLVLSFDLSEIASVCCLDLFKFGLLVLFPVILTVSSGVLEIW